MAIAQLRAANVRGGPEPTHMLFAMVLSISVATALTLLLAWHTYLVLTAQVRVCPFNMAVSHSTRRSISVGACSRCPQLRHF
jgi:hypothetical protein